MPIFSPIAVQTPKKCHSIKCFIAFIIANLKKFVYDNSTTLICFGINAYALLILSNFAVNLIIDFNKT
jgi:hypothetical protein